MRFQDITPVFRVFDDAVARSFYVDFLGFTVEWEHRHEEGLPLYFGVALGDVRIHLTEHHGDCCPGAAVRIGTTNLEDFQQHLADQHYKFARPQIEHTPWGTKELSVKDPFGNRLTFVEAA
ncbi:MAG: glyoxalase superfamily protein [Bacteroidota bacterium]